MYIATIHMKSGKTIVVKSESPALVSKLESIVICKYKPVIFSLKSELSKAEPNCASIHVKGINHSPFATRTAWVKADEVEFVQFDAPTSRGS